MITNIKPWGNSQGLYIPKQMLKQLNINTNDAVDLSIDGDSIVIRKDNKLAEKQAALQFLKQVRKSNSDINYRDELLNYLDERYLDA